MSPLQKQFTLNHLSQLSLEQDTSASGLQAYREMAVSDPPPTSSESLSNGNTLSTFGDRSSESPGKLTKDHKDGASTLFLLNIRAFSK